MVAKDVKLEILWLINLPHTLLSALSKHFFFLGAFGCTKYYTVIIAKAASCYRKGQPHVHGDCLWE